MVPSCVIESLEKIIWPAKGRRQDEMHLLSRYTVGRNQGGSFDDSHGSLISKPLRLVEKFANVVGR